MGHAVTPWGNLHQARTDGFQLDTAVSNENGGAFSGAFFSYGFRPFFLAAGCYAPIVVVYWLGVLSGWWRGPTDVSPIWWHGHEMVFGWAVAARMRIPADGGSELDVFTAGHGRCARVSLGALVARAGGHVVFPRHSPAGSAPRSICC